MTGELTEADRRILRRYGYLERIESSTSVRGMNESLPPLLNRASRRAQARKKGKR